MLPRMNRLIVVAAVIVAVACDAVVAWMLWFTLDWAADPKDALASFGFWLIAGSTLLPTAYAAFQISAFRKGRKLKL